jgi:hypothetical protein
MSKPLELVIFERVTCHEDNCVCRGDMQTWLNPITGAEVDRAPDGRPNPERWDYADHKRLTDAELAAEYHSADAGVWVVQCASHASGEWDDELIDATIRFRRILKRFATQPHYDEPQQA